MSNPRFRPSAPPLAFACALILSTVLVQPAAAGETTRVSVSSAGDEGDAPSRNSRISANGRYVVFDSLATNLVPEDTNESRDVFVHDRKKGLTTRVSVGSDGSQGDDDSDFPSISANGRWIVFESRASNLVPGDTNSEADIFVHDRKTGKTTRVSVTSEGSQVDAPSEDAVLSANGRWVAFVSASDSLVAGDTNEVEDVFVHDRKQRTTRRVSIGSAGEQSNGPSFEAAISGNGRFVCFVTAADTLVPDDGNRAQDVFAHDLKLGLTTRISVDSAGGEADSDSFEVDCSRSGRHVAFGSLATNLVADDTNAVVDAFVHDRQTGTTRRVSLTSAGAEGTALSYAPRLSGNGRLVAFASEADTLVAGDTNREIDVFVHDLATGVTTRESVSTAGAQGNGSSVLATLSRTGRFVVFDSAARNLVEGDENDALDVFVRDRK